MVVTQKRIWKFVRYSFNGRTTYGTNAPPCRFLLSATQACGNTQYGVLSERNCPFTPKTQVEKCAKQYFEEYWQSFLRLKQNFQKVTWCFLPTTQWHVSKPLRNLLHVAPVCRGQNCAGRHLQQGKHSVWLGRERKGQPARHGRTVPHQLLLRRVQGYFRRKQCRRYTTCQDDGQQSVEGWFRKNDYLRHCYYGNGMLTVNVDCLSNSAAKLQRPTAIDVKPYFYCNGKNVFDTFCYSKFGTVTACFLSDGSWLKTEMQYFLQDSCEVRRYRLQNNGKNNKKIVADFLCVISTLRTKQRTFPQRERCALPWRGKRNFTAPLHW